MSFDFINRINDVATIMRNAGSSNLHMKFQIYLDREVEIANISGKRHFLPVPSHRHHSHIRI